MGTIEKRDIIISLLDEQHQPAIVWRVNNAFPVKYTGPFLQAGTSSIAIETLEITHEGISVEHLNKLLPELFNCNLLCLINIGVASVCSLFLKYSI